MDPASAAEEEPQTSLLMRALTDSVERVDDAEEFSTRILDAAADLFCRLGIQRVTMEEVARAAGVARVTIYRRFATKDVLIEQVVRREFRRYFDQFLRDIKQARTAADRVVRRVRQLPARHPRQLADRRPAGGGADLAGPVPGPRRRAAPSGRCASSWPGSSAASRQRAPFPTDLEVDLVAEMMVRISTSFLVTPTGVVDLDDDEQVADIARRFLVPMIETTS